MKYGTIVHGRLNKRINRFIAEVSIKGIKEQDGIVLDRPLPVHLS
ncbi:hypothetical protein [Bacillus massilinigeriensis]|nr:hypothetical protein [Bacillus massilionigeriensis]